MKPDVVRHERELMQAPTSADRIPAMLPPVPVELVVRCDSASAEMACYRAIAERLTTGRPVRIEYCDRGASDGD